MPASEKFPHGSVVWAKMDGFPWWPGHVVRREEVRLDPGEAEPRIGRGYVLIEFFNDNKRFASMKVKNVKFFKCYDAKHFRSYNGEYAREMHVAVREAEEYIDLHHDAKASSEKPSSAKTSSRSISPPELPPDVVPNNDDPPVSPPEVEKKLDKPDTFLHIPRPPQKRSSEKSAKKRKKDPTLVPDAAAVVDKPRRKKRREKSNESQDGMLAPVDKPVKKKKERDVEKQSSSEAVPSPARNEKPKIVESKKRSKAKKEPRDHVERKLTSDVPKQEPEERPSKRRKEQPSESTAPEAPKSARKRERVIASTKQELQAAPPVVDPAPNDLKQSCDAADGYCKLTKDELLRLLYMRIDDVRSLRLELWKHRLEKMDEAQVIKSPQSLKDKCAKPFAKVEKLIQFAKDKSRSNSESDAVTVRSLEQEAVQAILDLRKVYFDVSLLKSTRLGSRLLDLTHACHEVSTLLCTVLRELLVQWVDILSLAPSMDDEEDSLPKEAESPRKPHPAPEAEIPKPSGNPASRDETTPVKSESPTKKARSHKKPVDESEEVEIAGTPKSAEKTKSSASRDSTGTPKDSDKPKGSGSHARRLSPEKFVQLVHVQVKEFASLIPGLSLDNVQLDSIAKRWEKAVVPAWKEDPDGYYSASLKLMKYMRKATKSYKSPHDDAERNVQGPILDALVSCLRKPEESAAFIPLFLGRT